MALANEQKKRIEGCAGCIYLNKYKGFCDYRDKTFRLRQCAVYPGGGCEKKTTERVETVFSTINEPGVPPKWNRPQLPDPPKPKFWNRGQKSWDKVEARRLYATGLHDREIAEILEVNHRTIERWRHDNGLPPNLKRKRKE